MILMGVKSVMMVELMRRQSRSERNEEVRVIVVSLLAIEEAFVHTRWVYIRTHPTDSFLNSQSLNSPAT
jgi:hypothetical protein